MNKIVINMYVGFNMLCLIATFLFYGDLGLMFCAANSFCISFFVALGDLNSYLSIFALFWFLLFPVFFVAGYFLSIKRNTHIFKIVMVLDSLIPMIFFLISILLGARSGLWETSVGISIKFIVFALCLYFNRLSNRVTE